MKIGDELAPRLEIEAKAFGHVPSKWIEALLRRRVLQQPTMSRPDELAFIAVQVELRRIGVHLHHILNQIEASAPATNPAHLAELTAHADEIRLHLARLRAAFAGNLAYWEVPS
ncbi:hypothetical protein [Phenylobacterium sp.]|uniref:hypothetical protein n=1 Tax=Phenylobacterium sp. TaxID=1871053 RepID=UPI0030F47A15